KATQSRRNDPRHQQHSTPLALAFVWYVVHKMRNSKAYHRLADHSGDREDAGLPDHHPECFALEKECKIVKADKAFHRLVQGGEMDRIEGGIYHEQRNQ